MCAEATNSHPIVHFKYFSTQWLKIKYYHQTNQNNKQMFSLKFKHTQQNTNISYLLSLSKSHTTDLSVNGIDLLN